MTITILEPDNIIQRRIAAAIDEIIKDNFPLIKERFIDRVKPKIDSFIYQSATYDSLINGDLEAEFGIKDIDEVDSIIDDLIDIRLEYNNKKINIFYESPGFFEIVSLSKQTGSAVPWLEWLMLDGNKIIIDGFSVSYDIPEQADSRSEKAIMRVGGEYRVNPQYSGIESDNWITRVLLDFLPEIQNISSSTLKEVLGGI